MEKLSQMIIIIECIFFILLQYKNNYSLISIVQIQNLVWFVTFGIYLFDVFHFYEISDMVYLFSGAYLFFFNIAFLIKNNRGKGKISEEKIELLKNPKLYQKINSIIMFFTIVSIIVAIPILKKTIPLLMSDGMNMLRYNLYSNTSIISTFEMMVINYLIRPFGTISIIVFSIELAAKNINIKCCICALINAFLLVFLTAGRAMLLQLILYTVCAIIVINGASIKMIISKYFKYIIPAILLLLLIVEVSSQRLNRGYNIIEESVLYYVSGIPYFSKLLTNEIISPFMTCGKAFLAPILDSFLLILNILGFKFKLGSQVLATAGTVNYEIAPGIIMNAVESTLATFYIDFGVIGICIYGFVLGCICSLVENRIHKDISVFNMALYLFTFIGIAQSVQNYQFGSISTFFTLIFLKIIVIERKSKRNENNINYSRKCD